jgi:ubiquinone/menaquinone biosynthesis C-methylase UbiE
MLQIAGDVTGQRVIDLGCGEGRFCRMLAERGAETLGVDLQPAFIAYAEGRKSNRESYLLGDMQRLDSVQDDTFDLAVSYITLVDVPDQPAAVAEAYRLVRPGGRFVVCTVSPMASAWSLYGPWHRDEGGAKLHYVLDGYTDEGPRTITWGSGHQVTNFHRMLSTTINDFVDAGFVLRRVYEPVPSTAQLAQFPENRDLCRVPIFTIFDLAKPSDL